MRISDWSSDVCSSDLMAMMFEPDRSIHDKPRPDVKVCQNKYSRQSKLVHSGFGASWINVASPPFTRSSRPDVTRYRWSGSAAIVRDRNDTADQTAGTPSADSIVTFTPAALPLFHDWNTRSEEHTSEL